MKPYYDDGQVTIYHGDCRDVLPTLDAAGAAVVLTDPPYGMNYRSGWSGASVRVDATRACLRMCRDVLPSVLRVLSADSHLYWFTRWDAWPDVHDLLAPFLPLSNALIWDKGHPGMGNLGLYGYSYEVIAFSAQGSRRLRGGRPNNILRCNPVPAAHRQHATEKPVSLLSELIERSTDIGELIVDPFLGAGSTLVAAHGIRRRAIGIEIDEQHCETAANRLAQMVLL